MEKQIKNLEQGGKMKIQKEKKAWEVCYQIAKTVGGDRDDRGSEIKQSWLIGRRTKPSLEKSALYLQSRFNGVGLSEQEAQSVLKSFQAVFQPQNRAQQIFCPTIKEFLNFLLDQEKKKKEAQKGNDEAEIFFATNPSIVPTTYKGVSYNPLIPKYGERFDILDLFSWGKLVQQQNQSFRFLVFDASLYWIINIIDQAPVKVFSKDSAAQLVDFLQKKLVSVKEGGLIKESAQKRNDYLWAISSLFPNGTVQVLDAEDLWKNNDAYLKALQEAIEFCAESPEIGVSLKLSRTAQYSRYNQEYQKWYSVLVLAEVIYLQRAYGITAKLGPTTEVAFDKLIKQVIPKPYQIFWYARPLDKSIPYSDYVFFNDDNDVISKKIKTNRQLARWLNELVRPFVSEENVGNLVEAVISLKEKINLIAQDPPRLPASPGDWWFTWPPGSC